MACRKAYRAGLMNRTLDEALPSVSEPAVEKNVTRLLFGVDSNIQANDLLQNNIDMFEWVVRNKIYPIFFGRYLTGENALTKDEIVFLHSKACKIALLCADDGAKQTEDQGSALGKNIAHCAHNLEIPEGTAIFLKLDEKEAITRNFMRGFAKALIIAGYTPGFKANTDARFSFDREFSRGMQSDKDVFKKCLIWAVSPSLAEYDGMTTTHLIHPDNWTPFAPSALTRSDIAIWQYGRDCHPIEDDMGKLTTFNLNLVRNEQVIVDKMF